MKNERSDCCRKCINPECEYIGMCTSDTACAECGPPPCEIDGGGVWKFMTTSVACVNGTDGMAGQVEEFGRKNGVWQ